MKAPLKQASEQEDQTLCQKLADAHQSSLLG